MRVILFILGLLFSADGLYFASTTSMGVGEAFTVAIGIMFILWSTFYDAFKTKGFFFIMRMIQKSGWNEADKNYWAERGWNGKNRPWKNT